MNTTTKETAMTVGLTAAIYARKSTEQSGIADEAKSVARQIEHARQYAQRKGWTVSDQHIFSDDGISGAEFARRKGLMQLLGSLKPKPAFQVLIMSEESRLGRESIEVGYYVKQLIRANVRLFFYLEDRERTLDSPTDKIMFQLANFADEMERERAAQRTYDAMVRKAKLGHICGGACYGYRNREVLDASGERSHVTRDIHEIEAAVVRKIFSLYNAGHGFTTIAKMLNDAQAPGSKDRKAQAWSSSAVRTILYRDLYRGRLVWGATKKKDRWGAKQLTWRPEQERIVTAVPHLQIVDDATWNEAHARLKNVRQLYLRSTNGRLFGKPAAGYESRYLLTGFTACWHCGGSLYVRSHANGRKERKCYYSCMSFYLRRGQVCDEGLRVPMEAVDQAVLRAIEGIVLNPRVISRAIQEVLAGLRDDREDPDERRERLTKELRGIDTELARFTQAIASGGSLPTILSAMQERERRKVAVLAELALLDGQQPDNFDLENVEQELKGRLADWVGLATRHPAQTRQILRKLLPNRIKVSHQPDGSFRFEGEAAVGRLLAGSWGPSQGNKTGAPDRT